MKAAVLAALLTMAPLAPAQQRDFLTVREVEQLREVQEPDARLKLYLSFAAQRIAQLEQVFSSNRTGRSVLIRDLLDQYTKIVEAIDTVVDDALRNRRPVGESLSEVVEAQKKMLARLEAWEKSDPPDLDRYQFILANAIDTTRDSLEMNQSDLKNRQTEILTREKQEQKERREAMTPESVKAVKEAEKKESEQQRKAPTLYRKGEQKQPANPQKR